MPVSSSAVRAPDLPGRARPGEHAAAVGQRHRQTAGQRRQVERRGVAGAERALHVGAHRQLLGQTLGGRQLAAVGGGGAGGAGRQLGVDLAHLVARQQRLHDQAGADQRHHRQPDEHDR